MRGLIAKRFLPATVATALLICFLLILHPAWPGEDVAMFMSISLFLIGLFLTLIVYNKFELLNLKKENADQQIAHLKNEVEALKKQNVQDLKQAQDTFNKVFNSNPAGISISDLKTGTYVQVNRALLEMLNYRSEEMINYTSSELEILNKEVRQQLLQEIEEKGALRGKEIMLTTKDGKERCCLVSQDIVQLDHVDRLMSFVYDITERKIAEDHLNNHKIGLEILTDQLTNQNRQLLNFAHVASHNLRSPVGNLNLLLQFYQTTEDVNEKAEILLNFEKVVTHLNVTLDELMETLKIQEESDKRLELLSFEHVLQSSKDILVGQIMETKAVFVSDFSRVSEVLYPKIYLESIMLNLISNALKYRSPHRTPKIELSTEVNTRYITLKVKDNGIGIDLDLYKDRVFGLRQTFHQEYKQAKGLGLFMTKTQIEAMGGKIEVTSEVGEGTEFKVFFSRLFE